MNEMIERVARAICRADRGEAKAEFDYERAGYQAMARAAIEAMREPTNCDRLGKRRRPTR